MNPVAGQDLSLSVVLSYKLFFFSKAVHRRKHCTATKMCFVCRNFGSKLTRSFL